MEGWYQASKYSNSVERHEGAKNILGPRAESVGIGIGDIDDAILAGSDAALKKKVYYENYCIYETLDISKRICAGVSGFLRYAGVCGY